MTKPLTHGPDNWPMPGKPASNLIAQVMIAFAIIGMFVAFPLPSVGVLMLLIAFFGGRTLVRELRKEWRQP